MALLELEATQGRDQATVRRPVGIACVRAPLSLLCAAALGLLPITGAPSSLAMLLGISSRSGRQSLRRILIKG